MNNREEMKHELNTLGRQFADRFNMLAAQLEYGEQRDLKHFSLLPPIKRLDELDEFARTLTTSPTLQRATSMVRKDLAEVRCLISDAVLFAHMLDYDNAKDRMHQAVRKLVAVRDRKRAKWRPDVEAALHEAADLLVEIVGMFDEAEQAFNKGGVLA